MNLTEDDKRRFWENVDKRGPDECWTWTGGRFNTGYGSFKIEGKMRGAHRISLTIATGEILGSMCALHRCDVRDCVNPNHLWKGTRGDNNRDRENKGRGNQAKGSDQGHAKLTESDVRILRTAYGSGTYAHKDLAGDFGVSVSLVQKICQRLIWRHVA